MKKFRDAGRGLFLALRHRAVMVQLMLAMMAVAGGLIIGLDHYEWLAFIICIGMVISLEIMNTAIERIGDFLDLQENDKIRTIKDLSGAAVLVGAIASLIVCLICVIRRLIS